MASLVQEQLEMAIESGRIRFSGEPVEDATGLPDFNHKNPADWCLRRSGSENAEYISLLRKCE